MVASILKIVITRNTICDNLVGLPKLGHKCHYVLNYMVTADFIEALIVSVIARSC